MSNINQMIKDEEFTVLVIANQYGVTVFSTSSKKELGQWIEDNNPLFIGSGSFFENEEQICYFNIAT